MNNKKKILCGLFIVVLLLVFVVRYKKPSEIRASYMPNAYERQTCVKIIMEKNYKDLEYEVNKFIVNKIVIDIDYGVGSDSYENCYSCCIHYIQ
ncbi:MAG: hypothetical protein J6M39_09940 [Lachnospiraceae bacterium]|nr:hypothetical protein [Lachnospiraceae bacterium]